MIGPVCIGIDVGMDGGLVCLGPDGQLQLKNPTPTIEPKKRREVDIPAVVRFFEAAVMHAEPKPYSGRSVRVFIERAQAMPKQGVSSCFSYGRAFGTMLGIVGALGLPFEVVGPQTWQKAMFHDIPHENTKKVAALVCSRIWPKMDFRATERSKKAHDGICDAALIAEYGRRNLAR